MKGFDPFGSMQNMIGRFQQFMGNPTQFLTQNKLNIPPQFQNNPKEAIQYLMNNGHLTQEQYNWANKTAQQIQNNPLFQQFLGSMK